MFTVIADAHLGQAGEERVAALAAFAAAERSAGRTLVWLGDTFDLLRHEDAWRRYGHLVEDGDILLSGNHDLGVGQAALRLGETLLVHGDLLDFGLAFARLQLVSQGQPGTRLERLLALTRRWSLLDVFTLYQALLDLPDWVVSGLSGRVPPLRAALSAALTLTRLWRAPTLPPVPFAHPEGVTADGEGFLGYFTEQPERVWRRVRMMYPASARARVVVIGHLHRAFEHEEGGMRLISLGAWVEGHGTPTAIHLDASGRVQRVLAPLKAT